MKRISFALALWIVSATPAFSDRTIGAEQLLDKLYGMWLGQMIGTETGLASEGQFNWDTIPADETFVWVTRQTWPSNDDTDVEMLIQHVILENGLNPTAEQIRAEWLEHIPPWSVFFANRQGSNLLRAGLLPPESGSHRRNAVWWGISPMLTTESFGSISPGMRQCAIDFAGRWAHITTEGASVHSAQFYAAMYASAAFESDVESLIQLGLQCVPRSSRAAQTVRQVVRWYHEDLMDGVADWRATRYRIFENYVGQLSMGRHYHWVEGNVNLANTVMALLYGGGSFEESVRIATLAGWDTDCNSATTGGLMGMIVGYSGLPMFLTLQCGDVYRNDTRPGLPPFDSVAAMALRFRDIAEQVIVAQGGSITGSPPDIVYHVPDADLVTPEPERPLPTGPNGLVAAFQARGLPVSVSASLAYYYPLHDRFNLNGIIDGVTDPTYCGHKAYWTDDGDSTPTTGGDWYSIEFPRPVRLERVVFHEGDTVYPLLDDPTTATYEGGFFESLMVEVRQGGTWRRATVLSQSEMLQQRIAFQRIEFVVLPAVCDGVRIRGPAGGTRHFTTIMELEAFGSILSDGDNEGPSRLPDSMRRIP